MRLSITLSCVLTAIGAINTDKVSRESRGAAFNNIISNYFTTDPFFKAKQKARLHLPSSKNRPSSSSTINKNAKQVISSIKHFKWWLKSNLSSGPNVFHYSSTGQCRPPQNAAGPSYPDSAKARSRTWFQVSNLQLSRAENISSGLVIIGQPSGEGESQPS